MIDMILSKFKSYVLDGCAHRAKMSGTTIDHIQLLFSLAHEYNESDEVPHYRMKYSFCKDFKRFKNKETVIGQSEYEEVTFKVACNMKIDILGIEQLVTPHMLNMMLGFCSKEQKRDDDNQQTKLIAPNNVGVFAIPSSAKDYVLALYDGAEFIRYFELKDELKFI